MTPKEFASQLPLLTNNPLPIKPPFVFNGISARVFPLRASLDSLQQLCDGYLNFIPPGAGRFRAYMPYVFLMVLDYSQVSEAVTRVGWFAQFELFFSVPVEWYKLVNGQWVFHDWAVFTPYIFVDDSFSVPLGRTVYGFPKVLAKVTTGTSGWVQDPYAPVMLAKVETEVFPEAYAGRKLENKTFLEIQRFAPMANFRMPLDPMSPAMPWVIASNLAEAAGGMVRDALWMAQQRRIYPINPLSTPGIAPEMLARIAPVFSPSGTGFVQNSLNLKQFRRCEDPDHICYQSLTNGQMHTTGFNGAGLLGEERTFLGDVSGGHLIRLYQHSSLPIVRTLGLDVNRTDIVEGVQVMEIKPIMPFWMDMNLVYDKGANVAWRGPDGVWKDETGEVFPNAISPGEEPGEPVFNNAVTTAVEAIAGPFQYCGSTVRVLPLLAHRDKMQKFLDSFINGAISGPMKPRDPTGEPEEVRLQVWSRPKAQVNEGDGIGGDLGYVYLTATTFSGVTSKTNNVGDWAKYELSFLIPVTWERKVNGVWTVLGVGAVPAYTFVDDCIAAISRIEVQGVEALTASFVRPESVWLKEGTSSIDSAQTVLRVDAEVWPAVGAGQQAIMQKVLEIIEREDNAGLGDSVSKDSPYERAEDLRLDTGTEKGIKAAFPGCCKIGRALALELLGNHTPFSFYTLKQFRDVSEPDKACHQAITRVQRVLKEVFDMREIEEILTVHIHDYPSLNIVETLGLVTGAPRSEPSSGIVYSIQAVRPFYICATIDEPLAERLADRTAMEGWTIYPPAFETLLSDDPAAPPITVDLKAETLQDQVDPCQMTAIMYQARERLGDSDQERLANNEPPITKEMARKALGHLDAKMVIDSVLSREWGNADENARWRQGERELEELFAKLPLGGITNGDAMSKLCRQVNNSLAGRPGAVASPVAPYNPEDVAPARLEVNDWPATLELVIESQRNFAYYRNFFEQHYERLACWELEGSSADKYPASEVVILVNALFELSKLHVHGEPSELNNLDTRVAGDRSRFGELLAQVKQKQDRGVQIVVADLADVLDLARRFCRAQLKALLNKLSRAYQKPDFCINRDSVSSGRDRLLPLSLSWDEDWYYGRDIPASEIGGTHEDCLTPPPAESLPPLTWPLAEVKEAK